MSLEPWSADRLRKFASQLEPLSSTDLHGFMAHSVRIEATLALARRHIPAAARILDVGGRDIFAGVYCEAIGAREVVLLNHELDDRPAARTIRQRDLDRSYRYEMLACDVEKERFPAADGRFDAVMCLEVIEHLLTDPMHMMSEINRVLKPGGVLIFSTPNAGSVESLARLLAGYCPMHTSQYFPGPYSHNREYGFKEVHRLMACAGMDVAEYVGVTARPLGKKLRILRAMAAALGLLTRKALRPSQMRTYHLLAANKTAPVRDRCPEWLYVGVAAEAIRARPAGGPQGSASGGNPLNQL